MGKNAILFPRPHRGLHNPTTANWVRVLVGPTHAQLHPYCQGYTPAALNSMCPFMPISPTSTPLSILDCSISQESTSPKTRDTYRYKRLIQVITQRGPRAAEVKGTGMGIRPGFTFPFAAFLLHERGHAGNP